jgi:hypothetical protein
MLWIDHQHGRFEVVEPGADEGVSSGVDPVEFCGQGRKEIYEWVERVLVRHEYAVLDKAGKGLLRL